MLRSTLRIPTSFFAVLCALPLALPATGCIGKRRPASEREQDSTTATQHRPALVEMSEVDNTLSHLVTGDRLRVPYGADDPYKGANAPVVTIVSFSDFQCPFCAKLAETLEEVLATYPDDVRLVFKQYPLAMHADAEPAARASLAAHAQGKFWEMHDRMFANPRELSRSDILAHARAIGLDMKRFEEDFDSDTTRQKVAADMNLGKRVEVSSTPIFFVNGRKFEGAQPAETIKRTVEEERSMAAALVAAGSRREEVYARIMRVASAGATDAPQVDPEHRRGEPSRGTNYAVPVGRNSPSAGPDDALVTVIEFGSYGCQKCKQVARAVDVMRARHPEVRFVARQHPVEDDEIAALAALAAHRQGKYWEMRAELLATAGVDRATATRLASALGLQAPRFARDLDDPTLRRQLEADVTVAEKFGGTAEPPYVWVNGRFLGPDATVQDIESLIQEEMGKAEAFSKEKRVARGEVFETMRRTWRGYEIAQQLEGAAG